MSTPHFAIVAFALVSAACSAKAAGPPEIVVDRDVCTHCGMLISEPVYVAAYQLRGKEPRLFDDIGCMLDALRREADAPINVWVQDATGAGWLDANEAMFVASAQIRTPMNGGILAYADATAARVKAAAYRAEVVRSLPLLVAWKGDAK